MNKRKYTIKNNLKNQQLPFKDLISEVYDHSLESPKDHDTQFVTTLKNKFQFLVGNKPFIFQVSLLIFKIWILSLNAALLLSTDSCKDRISGLFKLESQNLSVMTEEEI